MEWPDLLPRQKGALNGKGASQHPELRVRERGIVGEPGSWPHWPDVLVSEERKMNSGFVQLLSFPVASINIKCDLRN